jgi:hypothetical protein
LGWAVLSLAVAGLIWFMRDPIFDLVKLGLRMLEHGLEG